MALILLTQMCLSGGEHPRTLITLHLVDSMMVSIRVPVQIIGASVFPNIILSLPTFFEKFILLTRASEVISCLGWFF